MSRLRTRFMIVLFLLGGGALLTACTPVGFALGAGAMAGTTAMQERGFEQAVEDKGIELSIRKRVIDTDFETFQRIGVSVVEGRVLLTGLVPKPEDRVQVIESTWKTDGVVEVINEVLVGSDVGFFDTGYDLKIEKALELTLTLDSQIKAVNYIPDSVAGTLFLIGIAQSQAELDRVLAHAREVERVRRVVSYVQLKDSPERAAVLERLSELKARKAGG